MNKDQTLSHTTGRVSFKELQQIIKISLYSLRSGYIKEFGYGDPISI